LKKTLTGVLAVSLALVAAGCSGSDDGSGADAGPVELSYWSWTPNMDKVVEKWNAANPTIKVTVNKQDGGDPAVTKLLTAIKAGSGAPDIMQAEYQKVPTLVAANAITDIKAETGDLQAKFPASAWTSVTLGSEAVYGVPQDNAPLLLFYRGDVFDKLKIDAPKTWEDYAAAARKVHQADKKQYLGTFSANDPGLFAGLSQQAGASWWGVNGDSWTVNINDAATQKVAGFWGGLVQEGAILNTPMYTPEWNAALNDGTQIGWVSAVWAPGVLEANAASTKGKWRVAALPQWDAAAPKGGNWGGSATSVTTQSKHKAQAATFITWLNSDPEAIKLLANTANIYPAVTDSAAALTEPPAFLADQKDFYTLAADAAKIGNPFTYGPNVNVAYSAFNDAFGKAAESKQSAQFTAGLATMQTTTVNDMKNAGFKVAG
jgi:multiple sugar transport system substrate-binding protein